MLELELSPSSISQITQMSSIVASGAKIWSRRKEQAVSRRIVEARASEEQAVTSSEDGVGQKEEPRAHLVAHRVEKYVIEEMQKPLADYMSLPASQYSVLDAERIERVDENTFRCYIYSLKLFKFEIRPVLLVRVEEKPNGCCIRLLSCQLEGSPALDAQNKKFTASMVNNVSWQVSEDSLTGRELISDATIEVTHEIPFVLKAIPIQTVEATGNQVLSQILRVMLPRFLAQLGKDYRAWASGDVSRQPLGSGEI